MSDLTKKILLGLGLGAAVVTPLAITYYLTREEWRLEDLRERREACLEGKGKETKLFVTIRSDAVGAVIGRGGEVVRRIEDETRTRIDLKEDKKGDKVATIRGSPDAVLDAEAFIHRIIAKEAETQRETFFIPCDSVGRVIGKNGEVVHGIADSTETKIEVARNTPPGASETPVVIKGTIENIKRAKKQIDDVIGSDSGRPSRNSFNRSKGDSFNRSRNDSFKVQRKTFSPPESGKKESGKKESGKKESGKKVEPGTEELIPTQDGYVEVYVSTARSPSKFWVQVFGTRSNELDKMTEWMTDLYEEKKNRESVEVSVGDIVAAPFSMDESWYRVRVVGIEESKIEESKIREPKIEESKIRVSYLDFGDEAFLPREALCALRPEFITLMPFQAIECSLARVSPLTGSWSPEATKLFCDLTHAGNWIELKAFPVEKIGSVLSVHLLDFKYQSCPVNIADELISRGFAAKSDPE